MVGAGAGKAIAGGQGEGETQLASPTSWRSFLGEGKPMVRATLQLKNGRRVKRKENKG